VFTLSKHEPEALLAILQNALVTAFPPDTELLIPLPRLPPDLLPFLAEVADGDARQALNSLELALQVCSAPLPPIQSTLELSAPDKVEKEDGSGETEHQLKSKREEERDRRLMEAVRKGLRKGYDRSGEERYDMISALHKCIRGSDGSAAMYWLAR
jgi:putative ATPase